LQGKTALAALAIGFGHYPLTEMQDPQIVYSIFPPNLIGQKYINFVLIQNKQWVIVTCWSRRSRRLLVTWRREGDIDVWNKIYVSRTSQLASLRRVHRKLMGWRPWQLDGRLLRVRGGTWRSAGDVSFPRVCVARGDDSCCSKLAAIRNSCDTATEHRWRGLIALPLAEQFVFGRDFDIMTMLDNDIKRRLKIHDVAG